MLIGIFQMAKGIKRYFESFGEVESIRMHTNGQSQFGFVQYKSVDAAKAVLSKSTHRVAKCTLTVKPAHEKHQPDFKVFKPPKQDSPQHILNALNDDCLERVFKQFKLPDLSVAADVCVRFRVFAVDAFEKYKNVIKFGHVAEFKNRPDLFEVMLRNFGSTIHSLSIDKNALKIDAIDLLKMFNKYMPALKDLKLKNFTVDEDLNDVHPLFAKLQTLSMSDCAFSDGAEELLAPCAELKQLSISDVDWDNHCIDHTFPKLQEVSITCCSTIDDAEFKKFIASNTTLKKLTIDNNSELKSASIIQSIGQHLKNLVELEIDQEHFEGKSQFHKSTLSLGRLSSLKKLTLNYNGLPMKALLKKLAEKAVPLEHLTLKKGSVDSSAIKSMSELIKLNEIQLEDIKNLTDDHVVELAKELPQLRYITCGGSTAEDITTNGLQNVISHAKKLSQLVLKRASSIEIDMADYSKMLNSVQDRPEKIKLEIEITGNGDKVNVPDEVLAENREWLWIDEEIEDDDDDDEDDNNHHFLMMAIHLFGLGRHIMMHNQDSDESTEDEADNSNNGMNFDLD